MDLMNFVTWQGWVITGLLLGGARMCAKRKTSTHSPERIFITLISSALFGPLTILPLIGASLLVAFGQSNQNTK
ncbi:hypothetical protein ACNO5E_25595 [Vibrio parahaemolyticus]